MDRISNAQMNSLGTRKIYYEDVHQTDFTAVVTECVPAKEEGYYLIVLDASAFFPEEGGQSADKGTLNGQEVLDVSIKQGILYHKMTCELPAGTEVTGHVDWNRRFDFMQQHSGEHMISGLLHSHFGLENVGFHLSDREVTLDMNGEVSLEQLRLIEQEANAYVWKNLPVNISWPSSEELVNLNYRSKLALTENVRIVEIPGVDLCACCAPHVDTTGQIGLIKIVNVQSHRGGVRINILCGGRALADYTEKQDSVWAISSLLSAKQPEVADAVVRVKEDARQQKERANALQAELLNVQMDALPSPEKVRHVLLFVGELDAIALRNAVNTLTGKYSGYCGIFAGDDTNGYRFIVGSASCNCQELADRMRRELSAKGGGSAPMIQGNVAVTADTLQTMWVSL
ncbi:MAG: alanyl-tRNA editing protein [Waltera sp.]